MLITEANINSDGRATGLRLHDSELTELDYAAGRSLALKLRRVDGTLVALRAQGPVRVGMVEFQAVPILANLYVWLPSTLAEPFAPAAIPAWRALFARTLEGAQLEQAIRATRASHPRAQLVHCECSYGGELAVLCESLEVE